MQPYNDFSKDETNSSVPEVPRYITPEPKWSFRQFESIDNDLAKIPESSMEPQPPPPLFNLKQPQRIPKVPSKFLLLVRGSGAGHGVGLSQWGAYGLAKQGANYRKILYHYYKGVKIMPFKFR